jgi:hypothetical protein
MRKLTPTTSLTPISRLLSKHAVRCTYEPIGSQLQFIC